MGWSDTGIYPEATATEAFLYDGTSMTGLGGNGSVATAINNSGQIVGSNIFPNGRREAAIYEHGSFISLGALTDEGSSEATDINDSGQIVGFGGLKSNYEGWEAWVLDNGKMTALNSLIDPGLGFFIRRAEAINSSGQIAATATNASGQSRALLLTPVVPLPAGLPLLLTGLVAFGLARRRKA